MPPVFPSGQFPPGAFGQVRPVGATLPTAARRAPSVREAADGYTCPQARAASPQGNTSLQDCRVLPQGQAAATPAWTGGVDRCRILTLMEGATLATSSNRRKPECPGRHFLAHLQTRKRVSGRSLV